MAEYTSKHGLVRRSQYEMYMSMVDMRNFIQMLPEDKKAGITADFDTIRGTVQGVTLGVKIVERTPYSCIKVQDDGAPLHFSLTMHFDNSGDQSMTDFWIEASAELNMMMKMMLGNKIQQGLDKIVDSLVDASEGRMPKQDLWS